jgi:hypothetical protein
MFKVAIDFNAVLEFNMTSPTGKKITPSEITLRIENGKLVNFTFGIDQPNFEQRYSLTPENVELSLNFQDQLSYVQSSNLNELYSEFGTIKALLLNIQFAEDPLDDLVKLSVTY